MINFHENRCPVRYIDLWIYRQWLWRELSLCAFGETHQKQMCLRSEICNLDGEKCVGTWVGKQRGYWQSFSRVRIGSA